MFLDGFRTVVLADFEFMAPAGEIARPICLVAHEMVSGQQHRFWGDQLQQMTEPPYPVGKDSLFVAYFASAELGCHLALNWPLPERVLDAYVEFRNLTNGRPLTCGAGLLGALNHFGLDALDAVEKEDMRALALRGGPWTEDEKRALLVYCESDVLALKRLLPKMLPHIDMPRAILRGRYMNAVARIENVGVPIDTATVSSLRKNWGELKSKLIDRIDADYGVYSRQTFKRDRFAAFLEDHNIPWKYLTSGALALDDDTFKEKARQHPILGPLRELRVTLSQLRLEDLAIGSDGRNRVLLSPFRAKTGRNAPSNTKFIFGPAVWLRSLIRPATGYGLAYIDWEQQEFGIAAALSGDRAMIDAYISGDPYLTFAQQAGAAPPGASKASHGLIREQFKACALAVQYGMGAESLSVRIGQPIAWAYELLRLHHRIYHDFWAWSDRALDYAMINSKLETVFGWTLRIDSNPNSRSLRNFPVQANGAEMLRWACCFATERAVRVCAPIHDAILVEAPVDELEDTIVQAKTAMDEASRLVLDGFSLRTDCKVVIYPDRYADDRGRIMWHTVMDLIDEDCPGQGDHSWSSASPTSGAKPASPVGTRSISSLSVCGGCNE